MADEDKRTAVNIGVTLSSQLISSSLAILAVFGAIITFLLNEREINTIFILISILMLSCFLTSIFFGGKGIDQARKDGFNSDWNLKNTKNYFNWQACLNFVGIILFIPLLFLGNPKENQNLKELKEISNKMKIIFEGNKGMESQNKTDLILVKNEIDSLKKEINLLKKIATPNLFNK